MMIAVGKVEVKVDATIGIPDNAFGYGVINFDLEEFSHAAMGHGYLTYLITPDQSRAFVYQIPIMTSSKCA